MFGCVSSCIMTLGSTRLTQYSYVSFVSIDRSVWMLALIGAVVVCVDVVEVTLLIGGVFLLGPSVESSNTIFGKVAGFCFKFSRASLTVAGFCFESDCFLFGGLLCQRESDKFSSRSDFSCHWFLFVCSVGEIRSPFCCLGIKPPVISFIFCCFILSGRLSLCCFCRFNE